MARRACGFVGLPGGYGTLEEVEYMNSLQYLLVRILILGTYTQVFEVTTWTQLGIHHNRM